MDKRAKTKNKKAEKCLLFEEKRRLPVTKVGVRCQLSGKYRGAAHQISNLSVEKGQSFFNHVVFHIFCKLLSFVIYFISKTLQVKTILTNSPSYMNCKPLPITIEIFNSVKFGFQSIFVRYSFLESSSLELISMLKEDAFKLTEKESVKAAISLNKQESFLMSIFMKEKHFDQPIVEMTEYKDFMKNIRPKCYLPNTKLFY